MFRVVVIGTVASTQACLETLFSLPIEVVGLVTQQTSKLNSDFVDLTPLAHERRIPYFYWSKKNEEQLVDFLRQCQTDIVFCIGWPHIISQEILNIPPKGIIGYHPAPLPKGRGRHPLIWAMVLGLKKTDSCFFLMDKDVDSGDIINRKTVQISDEDNATTLMQKILTTISLQTKEIIHDFLNKTLVPIPQDNKLATYWRKRSLKDGIIDFRMSARSIHNLVRALTVPYPGATFMHKNNQIIVWQTSVGHEVDVMIEPGRVLEVNNGIIHVACGQGSIYIEKHECIDLPTVGDYL